MGLQISTQIELRNFDYDVFSWLVLQMLWLRTRLPNIFAVFSHRGEDETIYRVFTTDRRIIPNLKLISYPVRSKWDFIKVAQLVSEGDTARSRAVKPLWQYFVIWRPDRIYRVFPKIHLIRRRTKNWLFQCDKMAAWKLELTTDWWQTRGTPVLLTIEGEQR